MDAERSKLWLTPRQPKSAWSKVNKERVERLTQDGQMAEAGLRIVALAKETGAWTALDEVEAIKVPLDLLTALRANKQAAKCFDAFPPSAKRGILQWIQSAKTPQTRQRRAAQTVESAARNVRANSWPKK